MSASLKQQSAETAPELDKAQFRRVARVLREEAGIDLPEEKQQLAFSRLSKRLRTLGLKSFKEYCQLIESARGQEERRHMVSALTTNVTRFFREPHHFDDLRKTVLPPLMTRAQRGGRVRIWSAGCSSGEEPYSIALCVLNALPGVANFDVKILATDIDQNILARARAARYAASKAADVPQAMRDRMFERDSAGDMLRIAEPVRRLVTFNELNLMRRWPLSGKFDVLFCRNVVIYFDDDTQKVLWKGFASVQDPGARLYIGHSERLLGEAVASYRNTGITSYERCAG